MIDSVQQESDDERRISFSANLAAFHRIRDAERGPDGLRAVFDVCMEEAALAQSRGDDASVRALLNIARLYSKRRQTELVRRADAYRRRQSCRVRPVRSAGHGRQHRRVGASRPAAKCTSTGDPDPEPSSPARSLCLGGAL